MTSGVDIQIKVLEQFGRQFQFKKMWPFPFSLNKRFMLSNKNVQ
jgi:hypothetical protein